MNITLPATEWNAQSWYNEHADTYFQSTYHLDMQPLYRLLHQYITPGSSILDIGCGSGRDAYYWAQQGCSVHAIDVSASLLALSAQQHQSPLLTFECLDITQNPLTHIYDNMIASASLLHIPEHQYANIFKHLNRHLKQGGYFYGSWKIGHGGFDAQNRFFTSYPDWEALSHMIERYIPFGWKLVSYQSGTDVMNRPQGWHECVWQKTN